MLRAGSWGESAQGSVTSLLPPVSRETPKDPREWPGSSPACASPTIPAIPVGTPTPHRKGAGYPQKSLHVTWGPPRPTCLHGPAGEGQLSAPSAGPRIGRPPRPDEGSWAGPGPQPASGPRKASLSPRAAAPNDDTYSGLKQLHLFSPGFGGQESRDQWAGCLWRLQGGNPLAFQPLLSLLASRAPRPMQPLPQPRPCPRPQGLLFPGRRLQLLPQQTDAP